MGTWDVLTLEEAKQALNVTATVKHDAELPAYITATSDRLDRLIGPVVQRDITDEVHDGGREHIYLTFFPVVFVSTVVEHADTEPVVLEPETATAQPGEAYATHPYRRGDLLSHRITRRSSSGRHRNARFAVGTNNITVSYVAGRCADTASVDPLYKHAAGLMLANFWRAQQDSSGSVGEFDVPQSSFPRWAVPRAVVQLVEDEVQQPRQMVG